MGAEQVGHERYFSNLDSKVSRKESIQGQLATAHPVDVPFYLPDSQTQPPSVQNKRIPVWAGKTRGGGGRGEEPVTANSADTSARAADRKPHLPECSL